MAHFIFVQQVFIVLRRAQRLHSSAHWELSVKSMVCPAAVSVPRGFIVPSAVSVLYMKVMNVPWAIIAHLGHGLRISIHVLLDLLTHTCECQSPNTVSPAFQGPSVPSQEKVTQQGCVMLDTTAFLGLHHPLQQMEDILEACVLKDISVPLEDSLSPLKSALLARSVPAQITMFFRRQCFASPEICAPLDLKHNFPVFQAATRAYQDR
uniref:Uncharacterized protein n=1 Tax=Knipowitschia caucasica TaxID=637954 RepID=A0AAV2J1P5_KNICA